METAEEQPLNGGNGGNGNSNGGNGGNGLYLEFVLLSHGYLI